ncbi:hypothetical protein D6833_09125 [Candidatus Parcubacteria bacterium]|nr:MAG: hypothetical protein D6833_09125 [Candidatus Parcubacteria bacterium]
MTGAISALQKTRPTIPRKAVVGGVSPLDPEGRFLRPFRVQNRARSRKTTVGEGNAPGRMRQRFPVRFGGVFMQPWSPVEALRRRRPIRHAVSRSFENGALYL